uniref:Transposase Helix-turn-helix domain-containing protein n=1 Tax=Timema shepardi TaxID=629360 RepID=A0A7R9B3C4_TIMSH|nr:unnamed protein product [Timema shepardi]
MYREEEFCSPLRFGKARVVEVLLPIVNEALLKPTNKGLPLPPVQKLLLVLRYYATGNIQQVCGDVYGVSQTTAGVIINTVSRLFVNKLPEFVVLPTAEVVCLSLSHAMVPR